MAKTYKYNVALSFAGENREYVQGVATHLRSSGIRVFYDSFEQVELWGKDLYTHLDDIYRNKARFCVIFISKFYQRKNWTNHERKSAQARAFQKKEEYILFARFDDTEIPGVRPTVGYISLREFTPQQFAQVIIQKLELARSASSSLIKASSGVSRSKPTRKAVKRDRREVFRDESFVRRASRKPNPSTPSRRSGASDVSKNSKPITKTVALTLEGIGQLPDDKPVKKNNYTGIAKRGKVYATLQEHLQGGKNYVPGSKVYIERMNSIQEAQQKADRIVKRSIPKYNKLVE